LIGDGKCIVCASSPPKVLLKATTYNNTNKNVIHLAFMHLNTQTHTSTYLSKRVVTGWAPLPAAVVARVANRHGVVHEHARDEADRAVSWLHVVARVAQATVDLVCAFHFTAQSQAFGRERTKRGEQKQVADINGKGKFPRRTRSFN